MKLHLVENGIFPIIYDENGELIKKGSPETDFKTSLTVQGEGKFQGVPSLFMRLTSCNLRCIFTNNNGIPNTCDTPYSSFKPEVNVMEVKTIAKIIRNNIGKAKHLVITGGEPTFQVKGLLSLMKELGDLGLIYTIETNGSIYSEELFKNLDLISFSPKLESSNPTREKIDVLNLRMSDFYIKRHDLVRKRSIQTVKRVLENYKKWDTQIQVKFVVTGEEDLECIKREFTNNIPELKPEHIYLMPEGITEEELKEKSLWVVEKCIENGFNYCPRLHVELFGSAKRSV